MKVLLNGLQAGNRSGTGQYTAALARWLPGLAPDVEVLVLWPRGVALPEGASEQAFVFFEGHSVLQRLFQDQWGIRRLRERLGADLVHFPASIGNQLGLPNMVVTIHDLSFLHQPDWFRQDRAAYYRLTIGRSAKWALRVIADSEATAIDLNERFGVPRRRIQVVPLGVGPQHYRRPEVEQALLRAKYALPDRFFLYVGTLEPRKNLVRVIEAWSSIAGACPCDLVLAGRDGWKVGPVRAAAAKSAYASRIHFAGFIDDADLPALYSCADAFVWPSLWEGFGLPPLEAMACGVPVLTSTVGSLPEVVGEAALGVDPHDVSAIADGMRRLVEDLPLREALALAGPVQSAKFTWRNTAEGTLAAYRAAWDG